MIGWKCIYSEADVRIKKTENMSKRNLGKKKRVKGRQEDAEKENNGDRALGPSRTPGLVSKKPGPSGSGKE